MFKTIIIHRKLCEVGTLLLVALSFNLCFIDKPFNIDDRVFLIRGIQRFKFPDQPYSLPDLYFGGSYFSVYRCSHPPLIPIYLSYIMKVTGRADEKTLHFSFLIYPLLSILFMYLLGRFLIKDGFLPALMLLTSPTFMVMGTNIMSDVAMLSFSLAAVYLFLVGCEKQNNLFLFGSSMFQLFLLFTSYQAIFFTILLTGFIFFHSEKKLLPFSSIISPLIIFCLWCIWGKLYFGVFPFTVAGGILYDKYSILNIKDMFIKLIYNLSMLGFLSIPSPAIIYLIFKEKKKVRRIFSALFLLIPIVFLLFFKIKDLNYSSLEKLIISLLCFNSFFIFYKIIVETIKDKARYSKFIMLWSILFFVFANLIFSFGSARYLLSLFPALVLVVSKWFLTRGARIKKVGVCFCLINFALGFLFAHSDYIFAKQYKKVTQDIRIKYANFNRIWFSGELNFRHYMEEIGGRYLLCNDNFPQKGDVVVMSKVMSFHEVSKDLLKRISSSEEIYLKGDYVQISNCTYGEVGSGFYSHWLGRGLLPFTVVKNRVFDKITIYSVN